MVSQSPDISKPKLIAVVGATATGKTAVGVDLALALNGEVVNGDSRLFYRGMNIATAKPTDEETRGVRHHFVDFLAPNEQFSLADYLEMAREAIADISSRGKLPIIVGGSGQYVWALIEGWIVPRIEPDLELRADLETQLKSGGVEALAEQLQEISAKTASATDLKNPRRVIRAIERVRAGSSNAESGRQKESELPFDARIVGLSIERPVLHERVLNRLETMRDSGWQAEVETLLSHGYTADDHALSGIGYRQMIGHLNGEYDLEEAVRLTAVATNRLIRHQNNWFKKDDARINWYDMSNDGQETTNSIVYDTSSWLSDNK